MITKTPGEINLEHVMWQPTFSCANKCKSCYIGAAEEKHTKEIFNPQIYELVYATKKVSCGQFTLSLDSTFQPNPDLIAVLKEMWSLYETEDGLPQLCITMRNTNSLEIWAKTLGMSTRKFLYPVKILSLSILPSLGKLCMHLRRLCEETGTIINYNKMVTEKTPDSKPFEMGIRYSDMVYLVLRKNPLGDQPRAIDIANWFRAKKEVPEEKLYQDSCLQDSMRKLEKGTKCSAGISKVHVWPDGSVTGCPYDSYQKLRREEVKNTWNELLEAIENRTCHSMDFCKIPDTLASPMKNEKIGVSTVVNEQAKG